MSCEDLVASFVVPFSTSLALTIALYIIINVQLLPAATAPIFGIIGGLISIALIDILSSVFCQR